MFNETLPDGFDFANEAITSSHIKALFSKAYATVEKSRVVEMIDAIKDIGFLGGKLEAVLCYNTPLKRSLINVNSLEIICRYGL